jgi:hypothetical protein
MGAWGGGVVGAVGDFTFFPFSFVSNVVYGRVCFPEALLSLDDWLLEKTVVHAEREGGQRDDLSGAISGRHMLSAVSEI